MRLARLVMNTPLLWITWLWFSAASPVDGNRPHFLACNTKTTFLEPQLFPELNSKRIKSSYGPFSAPSGSESHGMRDFVCQPPLPCKDCTILSMHAGLEYLDGTEAVIDTGMFLHHVVLDNLEREDPMCKDRGGERFFASGNERTLIDLTSEGSNRYGYMITPKDEFVLALEVMNMEEEAKDVVLKITWEYIPSASKSFKPIQPYWFDIGGCGSSEKPAQEASVFHYSSQSVKAPTSGIVSMAGAHLHDGGTYLEVMRNGNPFCTCYASYEKDHIIEMTTCSDLAYSRGDTFSIVAHYNTSAHAPMKHADGELEPVMGISIVYAVEDHGSHGSKRKIGKVVTVISAVGIVTGLGFAWFRYRRQHSMDVMPVWLRNQYTNFRGAFNNRVPGRRRTGSYEPFIEDEYRDHVAQ